MHAFFNSVLRFLPAVLTFLPILVSAQNARLKRQSGWQQRVDHDIRVLLDEKQKVLRCFQTVIYTNNSPNAINRIPFHIWPSAFSGLHTAYGKEAVINGNTKFFNLKEEERGALDSLNFMVNGIPARHVSDSVNPDIVYLYLPQTLNTGETITITTPFRVKIPWLFSRMGYNGDLFSITQWYPKPAVYDVNGWNAFPYAEQGEYYSEFGDYEVSLDVPSSWRVTATGELQDTAEFAWLDSLVTGRDTTERTGRKTLTYKQKQVSDFAWFAKPDFQVAKGKTTLPGGQEVTTFAFYNESKNTNGASILAAIEKALQYYSRRVGVYPYRYCTVVIGPLQGAGGMEYPMITICADASEGTIIHEVGHNWFQGMLGSQEREHPWMDESINTFYQQQAEGKGADEYSPGDKFSPNSGYAAFRLTHDVGQFQCGHLHSRDYTGVNYGAIVYAINPQRFLYLQEYLGRSVMDSCMKTYFRNWQYKHPLPADLQAVFEEVSGKKLDWFFNGLLAGPAPDVAIQSVKKSKSGYVVKVDNKTPYELPFKLQWRYGTRKESMWLHSDTTVELKGKMQEIVLNASGYLPESNMANNDAFLSRAVLKTWGKGKFGFPGLYTRGQNRHWVFPMFFMWNKYDGYTPGLVFSNLTFPRRNWEYWVAPLYGLRSKEITGFSGLRRNIFHKKGDFSLTEIGLNYRRFSFLGRGIEPVPYNRFSVKGRTWLKPQKPWVSNRFEAELTAVRLDNLNDAFNRLWESDVMRFSWVRESAKKLLPFNTRVDFSTGGNKGAILSRGSYSEGMFMMGNAEAEIFIPYPNKSKKSIGFRAKGYASAMTHNYRGPIGSGNFVLPISAPQFLPNDPTLSHMTVARSARFGSGNGYWSQMLVNGANGIRMFPNLNTDKWVTGVNLNTHVLPFLPVQLFFDAAFVPASANLSERLPFAGGLSFSTRVGKSSNFEATLPLFYSKTFSDFKNVNPGFKWYQYATVRMRLDLNDPFDIVRNFIY
ncbi:MAG: M1 family metallopeptidase [Sphingomonadales bacterium]|jgi:hypothetical protein